MNLNQQLAKAIQLASQEHMCQFRWDGRPYILHCLNVMNNFLPKDNSTPNDNDLKLAIVAVLHDIVEDTPISIAILRKEGFGEDIIEAVGLLSKEEPPDYASWEEKDTIYSNYINKVKENKLAVQVKLADLADNMNLLGPPANYQLKMRRLEKYRRSYHFLKKENE